MSQLCMYTGKFQALSFISLTERTVETRQKAEPPSATHLLPKDPMEADRDLASGYALHPSSAWDLTPSVSSKQQETRVKPVSREMKGMGVWQIL